MHRDFERQCYCFQKVHSTLVAVEILERAHNVVTFVAAELGIAPPDVIWIQPSSPTVTTRALGDIPQQYSDHIHPEFARVRRDIRGGYTPAWNLRQIWLLQEPAFWALEFAAAHETRHIWQKDEDMTIFSEECRAEGDAYPYAYNVLKRYLASKCGLTQEIEAEIDEKRNQARSVFEREWPNGRFEVIDHAGIHR